MLTRSPLILGFLMLLASCASTPLRSTNDLTVVEMATLPAPMRTDLAPDDRPSLIGPLDVITIDVFGVPDLSREIQVDLSGYVSLALVGQIEARGKTSRELATLLAQQYRPFVKNPDVSVNLKTSVSQVVTVDGQVEKPGLYPVTNQMTLMRAIASAEGLAEFANTEDVVILREVGNQRMAGLYNVAAIRRGLYADPPIFANDVVVVGDSPARRLFRDVVSIAAATAAPLVAIIN